MVGKEIYENRMTESKSHLLWRREEVIVETRGVFQLHAGLSPASVPFHNALFSVFYQGTMAGWRRVFMKEDSWMSQSPEAASEFVVESRAKRTKKNWNEMSAAFY